MRFVVADDLSTPRNILRRILVEAGHDVVGAARNGSEAIEMCRKEKPDAVIFDVSMPGLTGDVAARMVLEEKLATHVFAASSNSQASIVDDLVKRGVHFVSKPYRTEQLLVAIRQATA